MQISRKLYKIYILCLTCSASDALIKNTSCDKLEKQFLPFIKYNYM